MQPPRYNQLLQIPIRLRNFVVRLIHNREALTVISFSGLSVVGGLVGNRVLTQAVDPRALGELYLLMNVAQWLAIPASASYIYIMRQWTDVRTAGLAHAFVRKICTGLLLQGAFVACVVTVLAWTHAGIASWSIAAMIWIIAITQSIVQSFDPVQLMERRRVTAGILGLLGSPLRPFALVTGVLIIGNRSGIGLLTAQTIYATGLAVVSTWALGFALAKSPRSTTGLIGSASNLSVRGYLSLTVPFLMSSVVAQGAVSAERWGIAKRADLGSIAIFVQAVGLGTAVASAATSFLTQYFWPLVAQAAADSDAPLSSAKRQIERYLLANGLILVAICTATTVAAPAFTVLLFGPKYAGVKELLPWTTAGAACFVMGQALFVYSFTARETLGQTIARSLSLVIYIALLVTVRSVEPALTFARLYLVGNAIYALLMVGVAVRLVRVESVGAGPRLPG